MIVASKKFNRDQLTALIGVGGLLAGTYVGLYIAGDPLSGDTVLSAAPGDGGLEEPTAVTAYARKAFVAGSVMDGPGDSARVVGQRVEIFGDTANPVSVLGWFLGSAVTAGDYLYGEEFAEPFNLALDTQAIVFDPVINIGHEANYGSIVLL